MKSIWMFSRWTVAAAAAIEILGVSAARADPIADFYKGKNVSIYVGFYPGGGYDTYARAVGQHLGAHIPGKPNVLVRNMPGASSLRAANFIYNSAPRDGTAMGVFSAGTVFAPLFGNKKAKFKPDKFSWIGNVDQIIATCAAWHESGLKTFDDILKQPVIFGAAGPTGSQSEYPRGINALLGARIQVIHGYAGGTGALLAMKRREVQGGCAFALSTLKSVRRVDWKAGRLIVLVQLSVNKHPDLKGIPHLYDYAKSDSDRKAMELIFGRQALGRPFAAPPSQPRDRTEALRAAFMATMKDPGFVKSANRRKLIIDPLSGAEVDKLIARFLSFPKEVVARARTAMKVGKIEKVKLKKLAGTIAKLSKKRIQVKGEDGKMHTFKLHKRRSKVKIGGKKAKTKALKAGMACTFRHYGEKDLAKGITCK
jgi:tripartite-type tricarboxylate transporter receptor subunit TctC